MLRIYASQNKCDQLKCLQLLGHDYDFRVSDVEIKHFNAIVLINRLLIYQGTSSA